MYMIKRHQSIFFSETMIVQTINSYYLTVRRAPALLFASFLALIGQHLLGSITKGSQENNNPSSTHLRWREKEDDFTPAFQQIVSLYVTKWIACRYLANNKIGAIAAVLMRFCD